MIYFVIRCTTVKHLYYIPAIFHSLFYFYFFSNFKDKISFFTFPKILMFCLLSTSSPGHRFAGDESIRYIRYIGYIIWHDPPIRKDINIFENSKSWTLNLNTFTEGIHCVRYVRHCSIFIRFNGQNSQLITQI